MGRKRVHFSRSCTLPISSITKNSINSRYNHIRQWPGNSFLRSPVVNYRFTVVTTWLLLRGNESGPLFCDLWVNGGIDMIDVNKSWPIKRSKDDMQDL